MSALTRSWYGLRVARTSSGSARSERSVKPTRSTKRTETTLRSSTLRPYHERVKADIERYGGTVEKFIGDAVMAVFGAPVAHEDDAERAVRASVRILGTMAEL